MSYLIRAILIVFAVAFPVSADEYISKTTLCLFKGHPKHSPEESMYWVEQKHNHWKMPFYTMSDLEYSNFKSIKVALKDGSKSDALIYLYDNRQLATQNVSFVNFDKTAYHFSGSEKLDYEQFRIIGGQRMVVDFGSCRKPEYNWEYDVSSTDGTIAGYVFRTWGYS
ncbi:hypothetical protein POJ06DRAFT_99937 [Lipomyces tetrasporus]|uniref:Uncharacterized protein n=1 Tax=Lipomyces tetrasporus TaxID=54092 RepID=A0AAD7QRJ4_9ASCO|nr:uncharacterized protein POJ06DRAFT_99937 [Lipomyces tetrasporus]KAJ8100219.1 hypothetical protein POJ06DRAFT_99937 [Lipomyces tetrasporus]